ncbi:MULTISPECIES: hypothetical protein [unclassified Nostoc]|jgi:hypothetical protein|uniref:hypothetical protein n=1 Tax=unclassified Nostoc TaxID=2593658 RepID=UPI000A37EB35|nr:MULTISPECIES: hypothetical protein [unclassified Nostoc]OUL20367.1 hypothetical protein BV375_30930 [Nostoc sp. 106C]OUL27175.1 hypothetical protein BV378_11000 [Nostoc sp. RF31YmG]OUL30782.1 hypothetical protein BV372_21085 [Nostoc sp. T09]
MPDEVKPNVNEAPTHDAQLAAENIAAGEEEAPKVDFEADYAAAQQFSVSEVDRTGEGAKAAQAATAPQHEVSKPEEVRTEAQATGNPDDYADMAKDVGGSKTEGVTNVDDDLVEKALEKGQSKN